MGLKSTEYLKNNTNNFYNRDLIEFEELNHTTSSIYNLDNFNVLLILKDGTNLTSWDVFKSEKYNPPSQSH